MIANGSWDRTVDCRIALRGFPALTAEATVLSSSDPDAKPLLERKEDFVRELPVNVTADALSCTLPPHSVSFIALRRA